MRYMLPAEDCIFNRAGKFPSSRRGGVAGWLRNGGSAADFYASRREKDGKSRIFFLPLSPRGTREIGFARKVEALEMLDRSGGRGNGKSARYYAPLTSGKRRRTISGRETMLLFILLGECSARIIRDERYSNAAGGIDTFGIEGLAKWFSSWEAVARDFVGSDSRRWISFDLFCLSRYL